MLLAPPPLVLAINPNTRLVTEKNKFFFVWRTTYLHDLILLILLLFLLCIKSTRHEHVSSHMLYRAITHSLCWGISTWLVVYGQVSATHFLLWDHYWSFFFMFPYYAFVILPFLCESASSTLLTKLSLTNYLRSDIRALPHKRSQQRNSLELMERCHLPLLKR